MRKMVQRVIHTPAVDYVEIETRAELVALFLILLSERVAGMSEYWQDRIAIAVTNQSEYFLLNALNNNFGDNFGMIEILDILGL